MNQQLEPPGPATIMTRSGLYVDLADPRPEMIDIRDIAGALSKQCRFGGHTEPFYSVAEHSELLATAMWSKGFPPDACYAGLLHDAAEAYLGDVVAPLKALLPEYKRLERRMVDVIRQALGIATTYEDEIKRLDNAMRHVERRALFHNDDDRPWHGEQREGVGVAIEALRPAHAESRFLTMYAAMRSAKFGLGGRVGGVA